MAEDKPKAAKAGKLKASESGNPDVHFLMGERQSLELNRAAISPSPEKDKEIAELDKRIKAIDKQLADLGVE